MASAVVVCCGCCVPGRYCYKAILYSTLGKVRRDLRRDVVQGDAITGGQLQFIPFD
jgi:hypothetical protein